MEMIWFFACLLIYGLYLLAGGLFCMGVSYGMMHPLISEEEATGLGKDMVKCWPVYAWRHAMEMRRLR